MNAVILNAGPADDRGALCRRAGSAATEEFAVQGWTARTFEPDGMVIKPCRGCFACWLKHPGTCAIKDDEEEYIKAYVASDAAVWITPITFGGYSSALKKALDRQIPVLLPFFIKTHGEVHHPQRYERRRSFAVVGTLPEPDAEAENIFRGLVQRNAMNLNPLRTEACVIYERAADGTITERIRKLIRSAVMR
jgi:multimeric flavodoxin WrbA